MTMHAYDHNPYLRPRNAGSAGPAKGAIDRPGQIPNFIWQTRPMAPTAYENTLGDAFEKIFDSGITELAAVVAALNTQNIAPPDGGVWTIERLTAELARLGA